MFARDQRGASLQYSEALQAAVRTLTMHDLIVKQHCDAFAVSHSATKSGSGSFMARDFQLATALVLQDLQAMTLYYPSDGRRCVALE